MSQTISHSPQRFIDDSLFFNEIAVTPRAYEQEIAISLDDVACCLYQIKGGNSSVTPFRAAKKALQRVYKRHADEFTETMTGLVTVETPGGPQKIRVFSLQGCHLLGFLARTPVAKAFRKWVLNLLENLPGELLAAYKKGKADGLLEATRHHVRTEYIEQAQQIFGLKEQGYSGRQAADELGMTASAVYRRCKRFQYLNPAKLRPAAVQLPLLEVGHAV